MSTSMVSTTCTTSASDPDEWRKWLVSEIMICLAGRAAEARARRPDRDGWRRPMDERERVAVHEAGHLVLAVAVGRFQNGAAIEAVSDRYRGIAQDFPSASSDSAADHPSFANFDKLRPDFRRATDYARLAVGSRGWLRYLRSLWLSTDAILADHWLATKVLAMEIRAKGIVRRHRAQQILDGWWDARGTSVSEALASQGADSGRRVR